MPVTEITTQVIDRLFDYMDKLNNKLDSLNSNLNGHMALDADRARDNRNKFEQYDEILKELKLLHKDHEARIKILEKWKTQIKAIWAGIFVIGVSIATGFLTLIKVVREIQSLIGG